jgi:hypothetical protein
MTVEEDLKRYKDAVKLIERVLEVPADGMTKNHFYYLCVAVERICRAVQLDEPIPDPFNRWTKQQFAAK